jgi:hypothetical protein
VLSKEKPMATAKDFEDLTPSQIRQLKISFDCETAHKIDEIWLDGVADSTYKLTDEILAAVDIIRMLPVHTPSTEKSFLIFGSPYGIDKIRELMTKYGQFGHCVQREACVAYIASEEEDDDGSVYVTNMDTLMLICHADSVDRA